LRSGGADLLGGRSLAGFRRHLRLGRRFFGRSLRLGSRGLGGGLFALALGCLRLRLRLCGVVRLRETAFLRRLGLLRDRLLCGRFRLFFVLVGVGVGRVVFGVGVGGALLLGGREDDAHGRVGVGEGGLVEDAE